MRLVLVLLSLLLTSGAAPSERAFEPRRQGQAAPDPAPPTTEYEALLRRGAALHDDWQLEAAKRAFRDAIRLSPDDSRGYFYLGGVFFDEGRLEDAVAFFSQAVERKPALAEAQRLLASSYDELGRLELAITHYGIAIEMAPTPDDYNELGLVYRKKKMNDKALQLFADAVALDPGFALGYRNRAETLSALGRNDESGDAWAQAIAAYRAAVDRTPADPRVHLALGFVLEERGQLVEAAASYRRALELDDLAVPAYWALGRTLLKAGNVRDAITVTRIAVDLQPRYGLPHFILAQALEAAGEAEEAEAEYAEARRLGYAGRR